MVKSQEVLKFGQHHFHWSMMIDVSFRLFMENCLALRQQRAKKLAIITMASMLQEVLLI